nr:hypothetical protein [uncultured Rhodoferax sp.]
MHSNQRLTRLRTLCLTLVWCVVGTSAWAGGNHTQASYRALEGMPELSQAPRAVVESLDTFLRAQEQTLEALLASQEAWAMAAVEYYPALPDALAFVANPQRSDEARRQAFLAALRIAPNSKLSLFLEPDAKGSDGLQAGYATLSLADVSSLPPPHAAHAEKRFVAIKQGDLVSPLAVLATATDEPDYGLDSFLWEDSPTGWGKLWGLGKQPFGNLSSAAASQRPFDVGFFHEDRMLYSVAPWAKRSMVQARYYQYSSLSALALRTGHDYWGWRFAGLALHYLQSLTHPYHARLAPGESSAKLLAYNTLARMGLPGPRNARIRAITNQRLLLDALQTQLLPQSTKALQTQDKDSSYPEWNDRYLRTVVAAQTAALADNAQRTLLETLPPEWVAEALIDLQPQDATMRLLPDLLAQDPTRRARLQALVAELMGNFGAHSRNALRAIVKSGNRY